MVLAHLHPRPNLALMLVGSYLNLMLYTLELVAVYLYFKSRRSKRDHRLLLFAVYFVLTMDTLATFAVCADVFALCVLFWGEESKAFVPHWSLIVWIIANGLGPFVVQGFMVYRYWRLYFHSSKNYPVSIFIILSMLVSLALLFMLAIQTADGSLKDLRTVVVTVVLVLVTDLSITAALLWRLYKARTYSQATHNLLKRIAVITVISGAATCVFSICILIATLVFPLTYLPLLFGYPLGRVYSLTMLFTLLYRDKMARDPWMHVNVVESPSRGRSTSHPETTPVSPSFSSMTFAQHEPETPHDFDLRHLNVRAPSHSSTLDFPPPAKIVN